LPAGRNRFVIVLCMHHFRRGSQPCSTEINACVGASFSGQLNARKMAIAKSGNGDTVSRQLK
jgi:hypothetical protein